MSKYSKLQAYLSASPIGTVVLSLTQVETILGTPLPSSARKYEMWWNNDDPSHSHCRAWGAAGFDAHPDLGSGRVRFERKSPVAKSA
jgi:hypothetical protein